MAKHPKKEHRKNIPSPPAPESVAQPSETPSQSAAATLPDLLSVRWLPELLLAVAAALVYGASLSNEFVFFDDDKAILYNRALQNPSLMKFFTGQNLGMYAPLSWMAYWVGSLISGKEAYGYHLLSLCFHAISAILVWSILHRLTGRRWIAFFCALLFAVHPVQVEAVSWAAALSTALFAVFYLASWRSYIAFVQSPGGGWGWLILSFLFFAASVLSKSAGVTLPLLLIATDYLFFRDRAVALLKNKVFYLALALWFGYKTFLTRAAEGHDVTVQTGIFDAADRFLMVCQTLLFYPVKLLLPVGFTISYPFEKIGGGWHWTYYAAPVVLALLSAAVIWKGRRQRDLLFGLALYVLPLAVMLPFRTVGSFELRSDRYVYISCIGLFFLAGLLLEKTNAAVRAAVTAGAGAVLGFLAFQQTNVWKDGINLFENCVRYTPESNLCQCNLAYNELIRSDFQNAAKHYTEALRTDPNAPESYNGRGQAYLYMKKPAEALSDFEKAVQAGISSPKLFFHKGKSLVLLNRPVEALPDFNKSLELEPKNPEAYFLRGFAHERNGAPDLAIKDYTTAIEQNPEGMEAFVNRGSLHLKQERYQAAVEDYTAALRLNDQIPMIYNNRANAYLGMRQKDKARADVEAALRLKPDYQMAQETKKKIEQY